MNEPQMRDDDWGMTDKLSIDFASPCKDGVVYVKSKNNMEPIEDAEIRMIW